jgi:Transposase DDE domain
MIASFEDFVTWMYVLIDTLWPSVAQHDQRPGPAPRCADSELVTMIVVGECLGWDTETVLLSQWAQHRDLFPHQPDRTRFNRRRRALGTALDALRRQILVHLDVAADRQCAIDSLPLPVMAFHLVPSSPARADWQAYGATFGYVASKQATIFGYKLHLLVTLGGVIRDFALAPANLTDLTVGAALLQTQTDLEVLGDKAYRSQAVATLLAECHGVRLLTLPRRNERDQSDAVLADVHGPLRAIIETVNQQLCDQFRIEVNQAHTFWGLCARLASKLTAHTLCLYLNRLLGVPDWLHIKRLAFN